MPTANAEGWIGSEGGVRKVSVRRVFRYLQIGTGPRRSPSACSEILKKKTVWRMYASALGSDCSSSSRQSLSSRYSIDVDAARTVAVIGLSSRIETSPK